MQQRRVAGEQQESSRREVGEKQEIRSRRVAGDVVVEVGVDVTVEWDYQYTNNSFDHLTT